MLVLLYIKITIEGCNKYNNTVDNIYVHNM